MVRSWSLIGSGRPRALVARIPTFIGWKVRNVEAPRSTWTWIGQYFAAAQTGGGRPGSFAGVGVLVRDATVSGEAVETYLNELAALLDGLLLRDAVFACRVDDLPTDPRKLRWPSTGAVLVRSIKPLAAELGLTLEVNQIGGGRDYIDLSSLSTYPPWHILNKAQWDSEFAAFGNRVYFGTDAGLATRARAAGLKCRTAEVRPKVIPRPPISDANDDPLGRLATDVEQVRDDVANNGRLLRKYAENSEYWAKRRSRDQTILTGGDLLTLLVLALVLLW